MGLHLIPNDVNFNFIRFFRMAVVISALFIVVGLVSLVMKGGPRYGIDFAGGVVVQTKFAGPTSTDDLVKAVEASGLPGVVVQRLGAETDNEFLVRTSASDLSSEVVRERVTKAIEAGLGESVKYEIKRVEMVGPRVGADLRDAALEAMFYAILVIAIYISWRFEQRIFAAAAIAAGLAAGLYLMRLIGAPMAWMILGALIITLALCWKLRLSYALGAIVALIHDTILTVGVLSILNREVDLTVIAALLTLLGYSLNDTIIVFDRIRETLHSKTKLPLAQVINTSINQTLSRTILTSGLTFTTVLSLFLFGGSVIHDFALTLLVGIIVGTYSSIFIASPILLGFNPTMPEQAENQTNVATA